MLPGAAALSSPRLLLRPSTAASAALQSGNRFGASNASLPFTLLVAPRIPSFLAKLERPVLCVHSKLDSQGLWEEPDDGNDSEYDEMDGEEIEDEERTATDAKDVDSQYEALVKEVQVLLGPAEKAILQQNEAPNLSKISTMKWPAFHSLALSIQIPFMDKLLEYGVHIDSVDNDGFTALHKAVMGKKEAVISHLLRKGANPHVKDKDGATPLHYAVQVGALQTVKLLIKYRVDVNVADDDGWTPLHVAIQSRSRDIAKVLLVNGADKTRRNKDGKTPLDLSLCYGRDFKSYELTKLLKLVPANRDP